MSLLRNSVNPLEVLNLRKLTFIPAHFKRITVKEPVDCKMIEQWINYNLNSRYAIKKTVAVNQFKILIKVVEIGIEDHKEVTMLTLACPYLHIT
jgi:hypothetical protein